MERGEGGHGGGFGGGNPFGGGFGGGDGVHFDFGGDQQMTMEDIMEQMFGGGGGGGRGGVSGSLVMQWSAFTIIQRHSR